jgi:hypothetical protein
VSDSVYINRPTIKRLLREISKIDIEHAHVLGGLWVYLTIIYDEEISIAVTHPSHPTIRSWWMRFELIHGKCVRNYQWDESMDWVQEVMSGNHLAKINPATLEINPYKFTL